MKEIVVFFQRKSRRHIYLNLLKETKNLLLAFS